MSSLESTALTSARARVAELREEVVRLEAFVPQLQRQLKREATISPTPPNELRARKTALEAAIARAQADIDANKARSRRRKREIDEWKQWYSTRASVPDVAGAALDRLNVEVTWRAREIASAEARIASLEMEKWRVAGELSEIRNSAESQARTEPGTPHTKDPRLLAARAARSWAVDELQQAERQVAALLRDERRS